MLGILGYAWLRRAQARDLGARLPAIYAFADLESILETWLGRRAPDRDLGIRLAEARAKARDLGTRLPGIYASSDLELYCFCT